MLNRAKTELVDPNLANYKSTAAATSVFALGMAISSLEGCSTSYYTNLIGFLTTGALAANQYAWQKHPEFAASTAGNLNTVKNFAAAKYSTMFGKSADTAAKNEVEMENEQSDSLRKSH